MKKKFDTTGALLYRMWISTPRELFYRMRIPDDRFDSCDNFRKVRNSCIILQENESLFTHMTKPEYYYNNKLNWISDVRLNN